MQLSGHVLDESRNPVASATVDVYAAAAGVPGGAAEASTTTDANGRWTATGLTAAAKDVKVDKSSKGFWIKGLIETVVSRLYAAVCLGLVHQAADPAAPAANELLVYNKSDGLYSKNSGGTVHQFADLDSSQTFTNKTLTTPTITDPLISTFSLAYYGTVTQTLPAPAGNAGKFRAYKAWGGSLQINGTAANVIGPGIASGTGAQASYTLPTNGDSVTFYCDGTYWWGL